MAILSGTATRALAEEAIMAGAAGFVPKTLASKSMISAAQFIGRRRNLRPHLISCSRRNQAAAGILTSREIDVLKGICRGEANKEIAIAHRSSRGER